MGGVTLENRYATALPELAVEWGAASAPSPTLLVLNEPLARELGLDPDWLRTPDGLRLLTGEQVPDGARPVAMAYAGHQFGGWSPRLGDGRALLLGELTSPDGTVLDLHLKGSGRTPFARGGDGLAAVGPMLREYVVSEAMHALGIPTTRSLAVVATGGVVHRESPLPGAVLARVASSHLRVGTFQFTRVSGDLELLRRLTDLAIERHCPAAGQAERPALALYEHVLQVQAELVAQWMGAGFVHGVMNTDNTTISGETIDYGPCAFMEATDPDTVYSSIDHGGRYSFGNQPGVLQWNLAQLAQSLLPLVHDDEDQAVQLLGEALNTFPARYEQAHTAVRRAKLGLAPDVPDEAVATTAADLQAQLEQSRVDHTGFYRALARAARGETEPSRSLLIDLARFDAWVERWRGLEPDADAMDRTNPVYVPRNQRLEEALVAATGGDLTPVGRLLQAVIAPYDERAGFEDYVGPADESFGEYTTFCGT